MEAARHSHNAGEAPWGNRARAVSISMCGGASGPRPCPCVVEHLAQGHVHVHVWRGIWPTLPTRAAARAARPGHSGVAAAPGAPSTPAASADWRVGGVQSSARGRSGRRSQGQGARECMCTRESGRANEGGGRVEGGEGGGYDHLVAGSRPSTVQLSWRAPRQPPPFCHEPTATSARSPLRTYLHGMVQRGEQVNSNAASTPPCAPPTPFRGRPRS